VDRPAASGKKPGSSGKKTKKKLKQKYYEKELARLQVELSKFQEWVVDQGRKVVVVFEGRDAAGKGGTISRITTRLNHRVCRVASLAKPTDREQSQWYFQRYVAHLPSAGEIVLFDRSWYNRATVEPVLCYCTKEQTKDFLKVVHSFERLLVDDGIILRKYWLSISREEQERRFKERASNPMKTWKLSESDRKIRKKWYEFSKYKDEMIRATDYKEEEGRQDFMWRQCDANDKYRARLNIIRDILNSIPGYRNADENPVSPLESVKLEHQELHGIPDNYQHFIEDYYEFIELDTYRVSGEELA